MNKGQKTRAVEFLRKKASSQGLVLPEKAILQIASSDGISQRALKEGLIRLKAYHSMTGKQLSIKDACTIGSPDFVRVPRSWIVEEDPRLAKLTLRDLVEGASRSWPLWPKNRGADHFDEVDLAARKRTNQRMARWMSRVRARSSFPFALDTIPPNDPLAIETLLSRRGNDFMNFPAWARGCDWPSFKALLRKLNPVSVMDIAIAFALGQRRMVRNGITVRYLSLVASGRSESVDALLDPITRTTRGCIIFPEQLFEVAWLVAGFSLEKARRFRRALITRREPERTDRLSLARAEFLQGARLRGVPQRRAKRIFAACVVAGGNGLWPRFRGLRYANLNYRAAYMHAHFP